MKLKLLLPLLVCFLMVGSAIQAQDNAPKIEKKTVIIKTIEEDGTESTETIEIDDQDKEVKVLTFSNEEGSGMEDAENIDVDVRIENGEKIITVISDGEKQVIRVPEGEGNEEEHRIMIFDGENEEGEHEVEIIRGGNWTPDNVVMPGLEEINPDDIKNINVEQNNGRTETTIELKDGKIIKKVIDESSIGNTSSRPFLGIEMRNEVTKINDGDGEIVTSTMDDGIVVDAVVPNSAAQKAGILAGDIITAIDGQKLETLNDLTREMRSKNVGDKIKINLDRKGTGMQVEAVLGNRTAGYKNKTVRKHIMHNGHRDHHQWSKRKAIKRDPCKPFIGFYNRSHPDAAVRITKIIPNTPAERHGLQVGDVILEMDGTTIESHKQLIGIRDAHDTGDRFKLLIDRDGKKMKIKGHFNDCPKDQHIEAIPEINNALELDSQIETSFNIFPNPSQGAVSVNYKGTPGNINIKVSDISGKVVLEKTVNNFDGLYQEEFDFGQVPEGTLIFQIENEGEISVEKLILQNKN